MGLNIKNPEVQKLAKRLANETGESMTSVIQHALEEKLERLQREQGVTERKKKIRELLDSLPPPPPGMTSDHSDLYDEWGLPK